MITLTTAFPEFLNAKHRAPSTRIKYTSRLAALLKAHGHRPVQDISPLILFELFDGWEKRLAEASLAAHRSCMVAFFNYCVAQGYCATNPAAAVKRYDDRPAVVHLPPADNVGAMLDVCHRWAHGECPQRVRDACIIYLAAVSGKRRGEVQVLKKTAVVSALANPASEGVYVIPTSGKTGKARLVTNEEGAAMLRRWLSVRPAVQHDGLWVTVAKGSHYGRAISERVMETARARVCAEAGVPLVTYQELRRLKATRVAQSYGLHVAAQVLGHSSGVQVVRDYYYNPDVEASYRAVVDTV